MPTRAHLTAARCFDAGEIRWTAALPREAMPERIENMRGSLLY